ncbi:universal stress protein [bacterium]|nr:universal stress protein [bacterium]
MTDIQTPKNHSILVPTDFSEASQNATNYAVEMAKMFDDEIVLLHVVSENIFASIFTGSENKKLMQDGIQSKLNEQKEAIIKSWPEARVKTITDDGKPYKVINHCYGSYRFSWYGCICWKYYQQSDSIF